VVDEEKRAVIVTGGSRGIGAAVARLVGARGYPVVVNFVNDEEAAAAVVGEIVAGGGRAAAVRGDVGREEEIVRMFEVAERAFGLVGGLVNNAGVTGGFARVEALQGDALARVLAVNVAGTILCSREAVRRMSMLRGGKGGSIVNISSLAADRRRGRMGALRSFEGSGE
jgi:NAD(P)-dependent dehydrogenase (short-subunit alcohol dehydrogenase family)